MDQLETLEKFIPTQIAVTGFPTVQPIAQLIDAVSAAIMIHRGGRILYANTALEELTNHSRAELLGMNFWEIVATESQELVRHRHLSCLDGEEIEPRYAYRIVSKAGKDGWAEGAIALARLDDMPTIVETLTNLSERRRANLLQSHMQQVLGQIIDGNPVPTFVLNAEHKITHWNKACAEITGIPAAALLGTNKQWQAFYPEERAVMADLVVSGSLEEQFDTLYYGRHQRSTVAAGAFEAENFFPHMGKNGRWLSFTAAPLRDAEGNTIGAIETLQDVTERRLAEEQLLNAQAGLEALVEQRTEQLEASNRALAQDVFRREATENKLLKQYAEMTELNTKLSQTKQQLMQSEKLASIGQLAAGVAHEINNPIGYVHSNIGALEKYLGDVFEMLAAYQSAESEIAVPAAAKIGALRKSLDMDFLREDIPMLMKESKEGITRVKKIVQDLKDFSHIDCNDEFQWANLHQGIDSTLNIIANEIKYKADVIKEYGDLPDVECLPTQINQVIMNLCVNAAHAISDHSRGQITIRSARAGETVWIEIADTGCGMPTEVIAKIFDPFFTTKPVGKGTGLGLSLSYGIIQKHNGSLTVRSEVGQGTTFRMTLPISCNHDTALTLDRPA